MLEILKLPASANYRNKVVTEVEFWQFLQPMIAALSDDTISYKDKKEFYDKIKQYLPVEDSPKL